MPSWGPRGPTAARWLRAHHVEDGRLPGPSSSLRIKRTVRTRTYYKGSEYVLTRWFDALLGREPYPPMVYWGRRRLQKYAYLEDAMYGYTMKKKELQGR